MFRNEKGIAMVTVLFIAATLTVVSSSASFLAIREFRSNSEDRRSSEALAYAEAGIDRMLSYAISVDAGGWTRLNEAGCSEAPISIPTGNLGPNRFFTAYLTVYDPNLPAADRMPNVGTWRPGDPGWVSQDGIAVCVLHNAADPRVPQWFAITSIGEHPTATRVLRQTVKIGARQLPVGLYANSVQVQGGNPEALDISLVTAGDVTNREKMAFRGLDPYYRLGDFWAGQSMSVKTPVGVHAFGTIYCAKQAGVCAADGVEHPQPRECNANGINNGQSQWDQSGGGANITGFAPCPTWTGSPSGPPPYSFFSADDLARVRPQALDDQDYAALKADALSTGVYCKIDVDGKGTCRTPTGTFAYQQTFQSAPGVTANNYVAYFDFPPPGFLHEDTKRTVNWKIPVGPCDATNPANHRSVIVVARYGNIDLSGKDEIVGAFFAEQGQILIRGVGGQVKIHGTAIADRLNFGGNSLDFLTDCWVATMTSRFLNITPQAWAEVDR